MSFLSFTSFVNQKIPARIGFFGDIFCNTSKALKTVAEKDPFLFINGWLSTLNYKTVNLETTLGKQTTNFPRFSADESFASFIKKHFDLVFTANNHCFDYELPGLLNTVDVLEKYRIPYLGTNKPTKIQRQINISVNGHKISYLCYTATVNGKIMDSGPFQNYTPTSKTKNLISFYDEDLVKSDIEKAKESSDIVVIEMHKRKGSDEDEHSDNPTEERKVFIEELLDFGADIIVGGHPHEFQGGKVFADGKAITYSLGSIFSDMGRDEYDAGCIMVLKIDAFENRSYSFLPTATINTDDFGLVVLPLAQIAEGVYNFLPNDVTKKYSEKLKSMRSVLQRNNLEEEIIPQHLL
jgi:poly-gamma-glutamate synthesis protein (capsule biosynthesis protein)